MKVFVKHGAKTVELLISGVSDEDGRGGPVGGDSTAPTSCEEFQLLVEQHFGIAREHQKIVCAGKLLRVVARFAGETTPSHARELLAEQQIVAACADDPVETAFLLKCKTPHHVSVYGISTLVSQQLLSADDSQVVLSSIDEDDARERVETEMLSVCSSLFAGNRLILQPCFGFEYFFKEGGPLMKVCGPCAHTCLSMQDVAVYDEIEMLKHPFACQCCAILKTGHRCFWADSPRPAAATELAPQELCAAVVRRWEEQQDWFLQSIVATARKTVALEQKKAQEVLTAQLKHSIELFRQYDDAVAQEAARRVVPVQLLMARVAAAKASPLPNEPYPNLTENEDFLRQMLHWFKHEFFSWVTNPPCDACGSKNTVAGPPAHANPEEVVNWASVVETYACQDCTALTRFPRYNRALRLLTWRKGRCGEWANCFCLLCIAMGYETRYVLDLTDHVWVEVFVVSLDRWVHLDPCENAFDTPHMYEEGWGKKLSYIFSFNARECLDVTRRYSQHPADLPARNKVSEEFVSLLVAALDAESLLKVPTSQIHRFAARRAKELDDLARGLNCKSSGAVTGRLTGSIQWRAQRGEDGLSTAAPDASLEGPRTVERLEQALCRTRYNLDVLRVVRKEIASLGWAPGTAAHRRLFDVSPLGVECCAAGLVFSASTVAPAALRSGLPVLLPWGLRIAVSFTSSLCSTAAFLQLSIGDVVSAKVTVERSSDKTVAARAISSVQRSRFYRDDASTPKHVLRTDLAPLQVRAATPGPVAFALIMTVDKTGAVVVQLSQLQESAIGENQGGKEKETEDVSAAIGTLMPLAARRRTALPASSLMESNLAYTSLDQTGSFESIREILQVSGADVTVTELALTAAFVRSP